MNPLSNTRQHPPISPTPPPPPPYVPDLLDAKQVVKKWKISARNLHELTQTGKIRSVRIGRLVRYDPRDLDAYLESIKVGGYDHMRKAAQNAAPPKNGGARP